LLPPTLKNKLRVPPTKIAYGYPLLWMMDTLVKKYKRQQKLSLVGIMMIVVVMMFDVQYLEKEETVVAAFVVACAGVFGVVLLSWYYEMKRISIKQVRCF
jgi:TctA family transporter